MKNLLMSEKYVLTSANIVFEFTKNTGLNRIQCNILFLLSRENQSIQKTTRSTRFMFFIVRVKKLLSNYQQRY